LLHLSTFCAPRRQRRALAAFFDGEPQLPDAFGNLALAKCRRSRRSLRVDPTRGFAR
jgi:hypothetical protein